VEDFGEEAYQFARRTLLQHDVELVIEGADPRGNLIGHIFTGKKNFGILLLEDGLGRVQSNRNFERSPFYKDMMDANDAAKAANKKWWANYVEPVYEETPEQLEESKDAAAAKRPAGGRADKYDVVVTEVVDSTTFYVQIVGEKSTTALEELMKQFAEFNDTEEAAAGEDFDPKVGDLVAGQFTVDETWYRARILAINADGYKVQYIDYGNSETIGRERLRPLTDEFNALMPQARECHLAFIMKPDDEELQQEATDYFRELAYGKKLVLNVEERMGRANDSPWSVSLFEEQEPEGEGEDAVTPAPRNIAGELLESGLVRLVNRRNVRGEKQINALRERENLAKKNHVNLWRYGEIDYDEPADQKEVDRKAKEAQIAAKKAKAAAKE